MWLATYMAMMIYNLANTDKQLLFCLSFHCSNQSPLSFQITISVYMYVCLATFCGVIQAALPSIVTANASYRANEF